MSRKKKATLQQSPAKAAAAASAANSDQVIKTPTRAKRKFNHLSAAPDSGPIPPPDIVPSHLLRFRANNNKVVTTPNGSVAPIAFSALADSDAITHDKGMPTNFDAILGNELSTISQNRPVAEISEWSIAGSPLQIITPNKTRHNRVHTNGVFHIFSNGATTPLSRPTVKEILPEGLTDKAVTSVKSIEELSKHQEIRVTADLFQHGDKRSSQNRQLVAEGSRESGSATAYTYALIETENKSEWLHLLLFRLVGKSGQHAGNLVAGSAHANTNMMFVEALIDYFSKAYVNGFDLSVEADLMPKTHLATDIKYTIKTKDFTLSFVFDAQSPLKPHKLFQEYLASFGKSLVLANGKSFHYSSLGSASSSSLFSKRMLAATPSPTAAAAASSSAAAASSSPSPSPESSPVSPTFSSSAADNALSEVFSHLRDPKRPKI